VYDHLLGSEDASTQLHRKRRVSSDRERSWTRHIDIAQSNINAKGMWLYRYSMRHRNHRATGWVGGPLLELDRNRHRLQAAFSGLIRVEIDLASHQMLWEDNY
jgi:hypothetical protein